MYYFRGLLFLVTGCVNARTLGDHGNNNHRCIESVRWDQVLKEIEQLNKRSFPLDCKDTGNHDLCVPEQIFKAVKHNKSAILQVLHETADLFNTSAISSHHKNVFLKEIYEAQERLKTCLQSSLFNITQLPIVKDCFRKMKNYLNESNSDCAWHEVHAQSREILQRIENYMFKRKGTYL